MCGLILLCLSIQCEEIQDCLDRDKRALHFSSLVCYFNTQENASYMWGGVGFVLWGSWEGVWGNKTQWIRSVVPKLVSIRTDLKKYSLYQLLQAFVDIMVIGQECLPSPQSRLFNL